MGLDMYAYVRRKNSRARSIFRNSKSTNNSTIGGSTRTFAGWWKRFTSSGRDEVGSTGAVDRWTAPTSTGSKRRLRERSYGTTDFSSGRRKARIRGRS